MKIQSPLLRGSSSISSPDQVGPAATLGKAAKAAQPGRGGNEGTALVLVLVLTTIALIGVGVALTRSSTSARLNERQNQYARAVAAAEASTEKILSQITRDYLSKGDRFVASNLGAYRTAVPQASESAAWHGFRFSDANGTPDQATVELASTASFVELKSIYRGLKGMSTPLVVTAQARELNSPLNVLGAVRQEVQLTRIPVFQFAMFSSLDMEISCGQPLTVNGRVHSNRSLYVEPDSTLTFQTDVTAAGNILFQRHPLDTRSAPAGTPVYQGRKDSRVAALYLPIGVDNTPENVRDIITPPPSAEDPASTLGRQRYFNLADMLVIVTNGLVQVTSGRFNNFATVVPTNEASLFVAASGSFRDEREGRTVRPIDFNVGMFQRWGLTNENLRSTLGFREVSSVYFLDLRSLAGTELGAVRVTNGTVLPSLGLTLATSRPLYLQGHYNQPNNLKLATSDTSDTKPASLAADAVTILSGNWDDSKGSLAVGSRVAVPTTVNAGLLTGQVPTTTGAYSGGMENFPRFLETWGAGNPLTYNGSMVLMFPSRYATNAWGKANVYGPPKRDWAFDSNFTNATRLPPLTPGLTVVMRSRWATVAPVAGTQGPVVAIP